MSTGSSSRSSKSSCFPAPCSSTEEIAWNDISCQMLWAFSFDKRVNKYKKLFTEFTNTIKKNWKDGRNCELKDQRILPKHNIQLSQNSRKVRDPVDDLFQCPSHVQEVNPQVNYIFRETSAVIYNQQDDKHTNLIYNNR